MRCLYWFPEPGVHLEAHGQHRFCVCTYVALPKTLYLRIGLIEDADQLIVLGNYTLT